MVTHHGCEAVNQRQMRGAVNHARCVEHKYNTTTRSWRKKFTTFQTYFQIVAFLISQNILSVRWTRTHKISWYPCKNPFQIKFSHSAHPKVLQIKSSSAYARRVTSDQNKFRIRTQAHYRSNRNQHTLLASFDPHAPSTTVDQRPAHSQ